MPRSVWVGVLFLRGRSTLCSIYCFYCSFYILTLPDTSPQLYPLLVTHWHLTKTCLNLSKVHPVPWCSLRIFDRKSKILAQSAFFLPVSYANSFGRQAGCSSQNRWGSVREFFIGLERRLFRIHMGPVFKSMPEKSEWDGMLEVIYSHVPPTTPTGRP